MRWEQSRQGTGRCQVGGGRWEAIQPCDHLSLGEPTPKTLHEGLNMALIITRKNFREYHNKYKGKEQKGFQLIFLVPDEVRPVLIILGFCNCKFTYVPKFICNCKSNAPDTLVSFVDMCRVATILSCQTHIIQMKLNNAILCLSVSALVLETSVLFFSNLEPRFLHFCAFGWWFCCF